MPKELEEKKATGEDSQFADATVAAGGAVKNRRADLKKKVSDGKMEKVADESVPKATKEDVDGGTATVEETEFNLEEAFGGLFEGTNLSEDFKIKTIGIFEAAVTHKVGVEKSVLEKQFESDLAEQVETAVSELVGKVDTYLDYVVENWMKQNEVAVASNIKIEVAESLLSGVKDLVVNHNIEMDDATVDVVANVEGKLQEANAKYNTAVEEIIALKEANAELERIATFKELAEGLTETQAEKLGVLSEGISYKTVDDYRAKVKAIKENYFTEFTTTTTDETEMLEETVDEGKKTPAVDPSVANYVSALNKAFAK